MSAHGAVNRDGGGLGIADAARAASKKGPPPVHLWDPPYCGEMDLTIRRDGTWWHEGSPIGRPALVRLFASILKREGDRHVLVTPAEKVAIAVEDTPFRAVDVEMGPDGLTFETDVGDRVLADADHPIRVEEGPDGEPAPTVTVRHGPENGLEARIDRKTFYRLVDMAEERDGAMGVTSGGVFFALGSVGDG